MVGTAAEGINNRESDRPGRPVNDTTNMPDQSQINGDPKITAHQLHMKSATVCDTFNRLGRTRKTPPTTKFHQKLHSATTGTTTKENLRPSALG
jgi:hypothetical protein